MATSINDLGAENRQFRMHPELLHSVITKQAGSVNKAILELVMNSIDAGATQVAVTLDKTRFSVTDDGRGFQKRAEIDDFFETFGTPHKDGDALYGRFRMGRGQIFAFSSNTWRSGEFRMTVDIKNEGLNYKLETGLDPVRGCTIEGTFYKEVDGWHLGNAQNELSRQCKYTPVPVLLNGERVNIDPVSQNWTYEDAYAYYTINDKSSVSVYNQGVLVTYGAARDYGVGGVVVTKVPLAVNFARNDVLVAQCKVWPHISKVLRDRAREYQAERFRAEQTGEWREYQAKRISNWIGYPEAEYSEELASVAVFTDVSGKHWSLFELSEDGRPITDGKAKWLKADRVQQEGRAIVINCDTQSHRFGWDFPTLLEKISEKEEEIGEADILVESAIEVLDSFCDFEDVSEHMRDDHRIISQNKTNKACKQTLGILSRLQYELSDAFRDAGLNKFSANRELWAMESDTTEAFTDGNSTIYIRRSFLEGGGQGPRAGISWAYKITALLVHEYLHDIDSGTGHTHDARFHELFHNIMQSPIVAGFISKLFMTWTRAAGVLPVGLTTKRRRQEMLTGHVEV